MRIGFIGTGLMGGSMAGHLLAAGHSVTVYTRTKAKAESLLERGASWAQTPAAAVQGCDAVITMVGLPSDVEELYFGPDGILEKAPKGCFLIDMTTSSPKLAVRIASAARERGLRPLDAPVSGGDKGAREATLTIMVGAEPHDFNACLPLFQIMGKNIVLEGGPGSGQHTKMANQIAIAGALAGVCEALAYTKKNGLDGVSVVSTLSTGAASSWQLSYNGPKMLEDNLEAGFYVKHYIKDLTLALEEADARNLSLPVTQQVLGRFLDLAAEGLSQAGTQALIRSYLPPSDQD